RPRGSAAQRLSRRPLEVLAMAGRLAAIPGSAGAVLAAAYLTLAAPHAADAQAVSLEYAVKAAYLYKFVPFVDWPADAFASASSAVNLCVVGHDAFGDVLDHTVRGERVNGREIVVHRYPSIERHSGCHIVYAGGGDAQSVAETLDAASGTPVLTFTDAARDPRDKGIVHFVVRENRVRFEIDDQAAAENGLSISSKVLSLAVSVNPRA